MLTKDRPEMARKAIESFRAQTYPAGSRMLLVLDSGDDILQPGQSEYQNEGYIVGRIPGRIGALRNYANGAFTSDIICHWDDDDYSHPNRIAEQVEFLQSSGADAVGYNQMLFWRDESDPGCQIAGTGEAWLYTERNPRYALGTSLCYWRKAWDAQRFNEDMPEGEDTEWLTRVKCSSKSIFQDSIYDSPGPRMIARIHAGNTSSAYRADVMRAVEVQGGEWQRAAEWDKYCSERMRL
jgi:glycosyltransferase involved in cell wall biosynthesis